MLRIKPLYGVAFIDQVVLDTTMCSYCYCFIIHILWYIYIEIYMHVCVCVCACAHACTGVKWVFWKSNTAWHVVGCNCILSVQQTAFVSSKLCCLLININSYHAGQIVETFHIPHLFLIHNNLRWGWLLWDTQYLSFSTLPFRKKLKSIY